MTSLNVHSYCDDPATIDETPTGSFWDTGGTTMGDYDGDHWSSVGASLRSAWGHGYSPPNDVAHGLMEQEERSSR